MIIRDYSRSRIVAMNPHTSVAAASIAYTKSIFEQYLVSTTIQLLNPSYLYIRVSELFSGIFFNIIFPVLLVSERHASRMLNIFLKAPYDVWITYEGRTKNMRLLGGFSVTRAYEGKEVLGSSRGKRLKITKLVVFAREDTRVVFSLGGVNLCELHEKGCQAVRGKGMEREFLFDPPVESPGSEDSLQVWSNGKVFAVVYGSESEPAV